MEKFIINRMTNGMVWFENVNIRLTYDDPTDTHKYRCGKCNRRFKTLGVIGKDGYYEYRCTRCFKKDVRAIMKGA